MPARLRDIKRVAAASGIECITPKGTSHWKFKSAHGSYVIPAHNGLKTEITDRYIRAFCKAFGFDFDSFLRSL